jgi:hypothetical protein
MGLFGECKIHGWWGGHCQGCEQEKLEKLLYHYYPCWTDFMLGDTIETYGLKGFYSGLSNGDYRGGIRISMYLPGGAYYHSTLPLEEEFYPVKSCRNILIEKVVI